MASAAYIDDVLALVHGLTGADITPSLLELAPEDDPSTEIYITAYVGGKELRPAIAVQQALQMSVDAAAIVVEAWYRGLDHLDRSDVESMLQERLVDLTLIYLTAGSLFGRWSINVTTPEGRKKLGAIGAVAVVALVFTAVIPPVSITVLGVVGSLAIIAKPNALPQGGVPLQTIDPADTESTTAEVTVHVSNPNPAAPNGALRHVYDVDLYGPREANEAFLGRVRELAAVAQSCFIEGAPKTYQRVRVWSSAAPDRDKLRRFATELGIEIVSIS
jgi:hypothetical protein